MFFFIEKRDSSKYFGVYWHKQNKKWTGYLWHNMQKHHIGCFEIEEDAAKAVNLKCQELNIKPKNPSIGVLDNEKLKKLTAKVIKF